MRNSGLRYLFISHEPSITTSSMGGKSLVRRNRHARLVRVEHDSVCAQTAHSDRARPVKASFSPHWDRLVRRAIRERNPGLLRHGRQMEMMVMGLVQFPERIQSFLDDERFSELAYLAEYIRAGVPPVIKHTDPVLFRNLTRGMARVRALGWHRRLKPGPLRIRATAKRRRESARK